MGTDQMHVRLKRRNQTVFLRTQASERIQQVKQKLAEVLSLSPDDIKLYAEDKERVLEDDATVAGVELKNDAIIYWAKRIDGTSFEAP